MSRLVDGILKDWGDRLFPEPLEGRRARNILGGAGHAHRRPKPRSDLRVRLSLTVRKAPEVMVKVSGGGRGVGAIKAHLDYISRHGDVALEDESGAVYRGREEVQEVREAWTKGGIGIPEESKHKQAFNIVLSMPPGTDRAGVHAAARQFAAEEFANHQYVFAEHRDEDHPHVHLVVKAVDREGVRLNPRKADLQRWRERFAAKLRDQGIFANATPRRVRGAISRSERQSIHHLRERRQRGVRPEIGGVSSMAISEGRRLDGPGDEVRYASARPVVRAFGAIATALAKSDKAEDRVLARQVVEFVRSMPAPVVAEKGSATTGREPGPTAARGSDREEEEGRGAPEA